MISFEIIARARQEQQKEIETDTAMAALENPRISQAELYEIMIAAVERQYGTDQPAEGIKAVINKAVSLFPNSNALHTALALNSRSVVNEYPALLATTTDEHFLMQVATCDWLHEFQSGSDPELAEQLLGVQGAAIDKIDSAQLINELCGYSIETTRALGMQRQTDRDQVLALLGHKRRPLTTSDFGNLAPRWASDPEFEAAFANRARTALLTVAADIVDKKTLPDARLLHRYKQSSVNGIDHELKKAAWLTNQIAQGIATEHLALEILKTCAVVTEITGTDALQQIPASIGTRFANRPAVVAYLFEHAIGLREVAANTTEPRIKANCEEIITNQVPYGHTLAPAQSEIAIGFAARHDVEPNIQARLIEIAATNYRVGQSLGEHTPDFETMRQVALLDSISPGSPRTRVAKMYEIAVNTMGTNVHVDARPDLYKFPSPLVEPARPGLVLGSLS